MSLYKMIRRTLAYDGVCIISAQRYYWGVGGGSEEWLKFVSKYDDFTISKKQEIKDKMSVERVILEMRWKEG